MAGIASSGLQNTKVAHRKTCILQPSVMTLEESHCHATKRPNRGFVNTICLLVECPTTFEKSLYQAAKRPNRGSVNTMGGWTHALLESFSQRNK
jgi:predicted neuraminidase